MVKKFVLVYLYIFLILDIIMGFLLLYLNLHLAVNPGQFIRSVLLLLLIIYFIKSSIRSINFLGKLIFSFLVFSIIILSLNIVRYNLLGGVFVEINNLTKLLLFLLIIWFINKNKSYFLGHWEKIIFANFLILLINITFSYFTGIGISTYTYTSDLTKGMLFSGNAASVLSLSFFVYFLFKKGMKNRIILILLSIGNVIMIGTKVIFLVPIIIMLYFIAYYNWNYRRFMVAVIFIIPIVTVSFMKVYPILTQIYNSRYLMVIERAGMSSLGDVKFGSFLQAYRRTSAAFEQMNYQINRPTGLLIGFGETGQIRFWENRNVKKLQFAAMDPFDIFFHYGIIGFVVIYSIFIKLLYQLFRYHDFDEITATIFIIVFYSIFGGYVMYYPTSNSVLAFLIGLKLKNNKHNLKSS